jgi:hypothetical protein
MMTNTIAGFPTVEANTIPLPLTISSYYNATTNIGRRMACGMKKESFPQRLINMLSNEEHSDVIAWLPHGKAFRIHKQKRFINEVFPNYFKKSMFSSFVRKLSRWGFNRVSRGPEVGSYYHPLFLRDNKALCYQIKPLNNNNASSVDNKATNYSPTSNLFSYSACVTKLENEVQKNMILIHQLKENVKSYGNDSQKSDQESIADSSCESRSLCTTNAGTATSNPYLSLSTIQASIDLLRRRISVDPISNLESNTQILQSLADQCLRNFRASAA